MIDPLQHHNFSFQAIERYIGSFGILGGKCRGGLSDFSGMDGHGNRDGADHRGKHVSSSHHIGFVLDFVLGVGLFT
jgi:hypothetical protein